MKGICIRDSRARSDGNAVNRKVALGFAGKTRSVKQVFVSHALGRVKPRRRENAGDSNGRESKRMPQQKRL